jgi:hypothetical protein
MVQCQQIQGIFTLGGYVTHLCIRCNAFLEKSKFLIHESKEGFKHGGGSNSSVGEYKHG